MKGAARAPHQRGIRQRLLSGGAWQLLARLIGSGGGMLVSMLLARLLPPAELGVYFMLVSIAAAGSTVALFGTQQSATRLISGALARNELTAIRRDLRALFLLAAIGAVTVGAAYLLAGAPLLAQHLFRTPLLVAAAGVTACWVGLRMLQTLLFFTFRGFHDLRFSAMFENALTQLLLLTVLLGCYITGQQLSLLSVATLNVAALALTVVLGLALLWWRYWSPLPAARGINLVPVLRRALPFWVSSFFVLVVGELHLWVLGANAPAEQVALYGTAWRLMQLVVLPLGFVNHLIPPMVSELHAQGQSGKLERLLRGSATAAAIPSLLVLALLMLAAVPLMKLIYGDFFAGGGAVLALLAAAQGVNVLTGSPGVLLAMSDQQRLLMRISIVTGVTGLGVSLLLAPHWGAVGVAIGYGSFLCLQNIAMAMFCLRRLKIRTWTGRAPVRDLWFAVRDELVHRHDQPLWRTLHQALCGLEDRLLPLLGVRLVECLGDSHASVFNQLNRIGGCGCYYFRSTLTSDAAAYGLGNAESKTTAAQRFRDRLAKAPADRPVLLLLGEVDCGYLIWQRAARAGMTLQGALDDSLRRYIGFLDTVRVTHANLLVVTPPLPAVADGETSPRLERMRPGITASQRERTELTQAFNAGLRDWARRSGCRLLDLEQDMLDPHTGLLRQQFRQTKVSHHLDREAFAMLIRQRLDLGWLAPPSPR